MCAHTFWVKSGEKEKRTLIPASSCPLKLPKLIQARQEDVSIFHPDPSPLSTDKTPRPPSPRIATGRLHQPLLITAGDELCLEEESGQRWRAGLAPTTSLPR